MSRLLFCLWLLGALWLAGCSEKLVRVQPYEMEYLARDKMLFTPLESRAAFEAHIFGIREASAGGASGFQGGCGCR